MKGLEVLELFSGIGAFSKGLERAGISFNIVGFSDIYEEANKAFSTLYNVPMELSLGDVCNVDGNQFKGIDIITHGSPCQSLTRSGHMEGADEGSGTRSSLMWETVRIVDQAKPKYVLWEQVPDVKSKRNIHNFNKYIERLDELGYNTYDTILNAHDFGSAQKRRRVFAISIRKDIDDQTFKFPIGTRHAKPLKAYIEPRTDDTFLVPEHVVEDMVVERIGYNHYKIKNATKKGYLIAEEYDGIDFSFSKSKTRRGRVQKQAVQTVLTGKTIGTLIDDKFYYLTPKEYWLLQEFDESDYNKVAKLGFYNTDMYLLAGNSINVNVTTEIFKSLFKM